MIRISSKDKRVLAIDPTHRGFGYVVFEGPEFLVDWGIRTVNGRNLADAAASAERLIARYRSHVLVIEDGRGVRFRRGHRARIFLDFLARTAEGKGLEVRRISRSAVLKVFGRFGLATKDRIARIIAARFPELARRLPAERRSWMSEDLRMSIFDAAAFALTSFAANRSSHRRQGGDSSDGVKRAQRS